MSVADIRQTYPRKIKIGNNRFTLRPLQAEDKDAFLEFSNSLPEKDLQLLRHDITQPEAFDRRIGEIAQGTRVTVIAEIDGEVAGYGGINRRPLSWFRHLGEIRVIVSQARRGTGVGSALAREMLEIGHDLGMTKLVAQMAREQAAARHVFEGLGFVAEALLTDWVMDREGRTQDMILMSLDVTGLTN
jgi:L-amino acid N-acyltransferase YncA